MQMPDTITPEFEALLKEWAYTPGFYTLKNGIKYRVWWEGEEFKVEEVAD